MMYGPHAVVGEDDVLGVVVAVGRDADERKVLLQAQVVERLRGQRVGRVAELEAVVEQRLPVERNARGRRRPELGCCGP